MYASGMGFREIERLTGVNHNTIIYWAKQAGSISPQEPESEDTQSNAEFDESDRE
jgi:insertion element IS1 protein InsB